MNAARTLHENSLYRLVREPDARSGRDYQFLEFKNPGVRILARDTLGRFLLVRQYRHPLATFTWELPAGGVEPGEPYIAAAKRELLEETGFTASNWRSLGRMNSMANVSNFEALLFLATDLSQYPAHTMHHGNFEVEDCKFFSKEELLVLTCSQRLRDDKTLAALYILEASALEQMD